MFESYLVLRSIILQPMVINFLKFPIINCMACLFYDFIPDETGMCALGFFIYMKLR